jgi:pimeloyl-ACP methyl ester carboxylesterase
MDPARSDHSLTASQFHDSRRFVDTDFGRIAYVERGEGPVALFIHGAALNGYQWRHQLTGLSDIRRVIALDSMAMGYTEMKPGQPLGMKQQAAMFRAFVDRLEIDRVDLVGNDSGGGAAQIFAATNPDRVRTLTLTNCEVNDYDSDTPAAVRFREAMQSGQMVATLRAAADNPALARTAFAQVYQDVNALPDEVLPTYIRPLVQSPARIEQMLGYFAATTNQDTIAIAGALARLPAPTLVMWGTADGFFPVKWAYWLKDHLPRVEEVVEVKDGRLFWPEEHTELFNRKLRELWTRHG